MRKTIIQILLIVIVAISFERCEKKIGEDIPIENSDTITHIPGSNIIEYLPLDSLTYSIIYYDPIWLNSKDILDINNDSKDDIFIKSESYLDMDNDCYVCRRTEMNFYLFYFSDSVFVGCNHCDDAFPFSPAISLHSSIDSVFQNINCWENEARIYWDTYESSSGYETDDNDSIIEVNNSSYTPDFYWKDFDTAYFAVTLHDSLGIKVGKLKLSMGDDFNFYLYEIHVSDQYLKQEE